MKKTENDTQIQKFRELARKLQADEDPEAFKAKLKKVAQAPKPAAAKRD